MKTNKNRANRKGVHLRAIWTVSRLFFGVAEGGSRAPLDRWSKASVRILAIFCVCAGIAFAQQSSSAPVAQQSSSVPLSALTSSLSGLTGGTTLHDLSLQGTGTSNLAAKSETGSISILCSVNGYGQLQFQTPNAPRTETYQLTNGTARGSWTGSDGTQHTVANHNLLTGEQWFCPAVLLSRLVKATNTSLQFVGIESRNGQSLEHFLVTRSISGLPLSKQSALLTHLTELNIFLDVQTLHPAILAFNAHPDNNASIDIPIEIRFENYIQSAGIWYPSRIEKHINNSLVLGLDVQSAAFNKGSSNPLLVN